MEGDLSFASVTVEGVQNSRDAQKADDMRQRAIDANEYSRTKQSITAPKSPTRTRFRETIEGMGGVDNALRMMREAETGVDEDVAVVQAKANLIRKIRQYYTLKRHEGHPQIKKLEKCTLDELKTEEALLLKDSTYAMDIAFESYASGLELVEDISKRFNPMKLNLTGLGMVARSNKPVLEESIKEVLIYYSDWLPSGGPVSRLLGATLTLCKLVHEKNMALGVPFDKQTPPTYKTTPPAPPPSPETVPVAPKGILKNSGNAVELSKASSTVPVSAQEMAIVSKAAAKPGRKPKSANQNS